jgi:hypothetical protein
VPDPKKSYTQNISKFSAEELAPYEGQYVAFSPDGTTILTAAPSISELALQLKQMGLAPVDYEIEPIPPSDVALIL